MVARLDECCTQQRSGCTSCSSSRFSLSLSLSFSLSLSLSLSLSRSLARSLALSLAHSLTHSLYVQSLPGMATENALALPEVALDLRGTASIDASEALITETIGLFGLFARHANDEFGGQAGGEGGVGEMSLVAQLGSVARNQLFLALTLSLSGLYFVVTGIQFWVTDYMTTPVSLSLSLSLSLPPSLPPSLSPSLCV